MNRLHPSRPVITWAGRPLDAHILRTSVAFLLIHSSSKQSTHLISSVEAIMGLGTDASSRVDPRSKLFHWHCHAKAKWRGKRKKKQNTIYDKSKAQQVLRVCVHLTLTLTLIQEIALDIFSAVSMQHLAKSNHNCYRSTKNNLFNRTTKWPAGLV